MDETNLLLKKKKVIKTLLIIMFGTIIFSAVGYFLIYKKTNVTPFLIAIGFILLIIALMAIIELNYKPKNVESKTEPKIANNSRKITAYFNIGIGVCSIIISSIKLAEGENTTTLYTFIIAGIIMIFNGIRLIRNKEISRGIYGTNASELKNK